VKFAGGHFGFGEGIGLTVRLTYRFTECFFTIGFFGEAELTLDFAPDFKVGSGLGLLVAALPTAIGSNNAMNNEMKNLSDLFTLYPI
jgi:hypothetical protein